MMEFKMMFMIMFGSGAMITMPLFKSFKGIKFGFMIITVSIYAIFPLNYVMISEFFLLDLLSVSLVFLSVWVVFFLILTNPLTYKLGPWNNIYYFAIILFLPLIGFSFMMNNVLGFYILFEMSLMPIIFILMGWGYQVERVQAGFYFLLYTIFASMPFLLFVLSTDVSMTKFFSVDIPMIYFNSRFMEVVGGAITLLVFLVKLPMYLFHMWLPKAHVEAPVSGSMILAAVLLKMGGYGLFRMIESTQTFKYLFQWLIWISCLGAVSVSLMCVKLNDLKSLAAYSSVSHMAMSLAGIMTLLKSGTSGALMMFLSHGVCSSGMFYLIGSLYSFSKSRSLTINKGLMSMTKAFTLMMFLIFITNMAAPLTMNLFSEIYILMSLISFSLAPLTAVLMSVFLVAYYTISIFSSVIHGVNNNLSKNYFNLKFDTYLLVWLHIFILFISFFIINVIYLFIL